MSEPRTQIRDYVEWTIEKTPRIRVVGRYAAYTVGYLVAILVDASGPATVLNRRLPDDPDDSVDMYRTQARRAGSSVWIPVQASRRRAWLDVYDDPDSCETLDLQVLQIRGATPLRRWRHPKTEDSRWRVRLACRDGGTENDGLELEGAWLELAWLATIGGWPEPELPEGPRTSPV
ncbi:hypothetical protein Bcav_3856 [Beutenbergia cavernae DSM 12333]|uniref:Uncharacterized protein n=1 Tax=Beutenbergia cavernae (strain ATCC BAA-8 / DSM 12333 / CCUG 43141 / JCM 11478 / NBRC 16432 / NCIMB 13614 / HKI 0122) TaxID=471853 RepID=C5C4H4_BEUC1|nr:hypothetical protein [Beutenbergia cavernae]ACQ82098.1 hypothetical protein Bcav_3856 [Beutenbergia cavernae DSM 12333]